MRKRGFWASNHHNLASQRRAKICTMAAETLQIFANPAVLRTFWQFLTVFANLLTWPG
jgi:hypothetical protein